MPMMAKYALYGEMMTLATSDWTNDKAEITRTRYALRDLILLIQRELGVSVPGKGK